MSVILSAYTKNAFKEYVLPNIDNTNYKIVFESRIFGTSEDTEVNFDIIEQNWRILPGDGYTLDGASDFGVALTDGTELNICCLDGTNIHISVAYTEENYIYTRKFAIPSGVTQITIGSAEDNDIVCTGSKFLSRHHARLFLLPDGWYVENMSKNGVFIDSVRVNYKESLSYGAFINIIGIKIVFLGDTLAVNGYGEISVSGKLIPINTDSSNVPTVKKEKVRSFFNRAPRIFDDLITEKIEIEAPPSPIRENRRPLFMTIGPAFTMAIPMVLSCVLMVYASKKAGGTSGGFMLTGVITAVASAVLGVFWALMNIRYERKKNVESESQRFESYSDYLMTMAEKVKSAYEHNTDALLSRYPSSAECAEKAPESSKLWNRNISHTDFLSHRVGLGELPFQAEICIPKEKFCLIKDSLAKKPQLIHDTYCNLKNVPICVDLMENHIIGIVGGRDKLGAYEVVRNLSVQIAASNCYTDVKLCYVFSENSFNKQMSFAKWLPHCWSENKKTRFCACSKDEASDVFFELTKVFRMREDSLRSGSSKDNSPLPHYVLFLEDLSVLEGEPISKYIFDNSDDIGITTVLLTDSYENLPNSCECIIYNDGELTGVYTPQTLSGLGNNLLHDEVSPAQAEAFARKLSDIQVAEISAGGDIPNSLSFLDMYHVESVKDIPIIENWKKNRTYENMRALIGQKAGGIGCYLDVHEKYHGPHGLVAGTTGSGKSETLQTYILSLAVSYSPDDIGFLIIDFKGGGMANLFSNLPHMLGQISNLSGNQIRRAMISIKSENLRRQRVFGEYGVNNINAYTRLLKNNEASVPMPHLFIIIDEFAELKREEPEFMSELISVAQVGRSLGVHLILATQKPGGTVDDNIRSNSKFKLCLRVQDRQDSTEMLGKPDAAYLSQAGKCYLQVGNDEIFELFQSGWSGAAYNEDMIGVQASPAILVSMTGKTAIVGNKALARRKDEARREWLGAFASCVSAAEQDTGLSVEDAVNNYDCMKTLEKCIYDMLSQMGIDYPASQHNTRALENFIALSAELGTDRIEAIASKAEYTKTALPEMKEKTQLDALVDYMHALAERFGYKRNLRLWMPPLPERFVISELPEFSQHAYCEGRWPEHDSWSLSAPVGLCDDPVNQTQIPLYVDFAKDGHLAVCGNATSGKSTFLQTLIWSLINMYTPAQLNVYAIDYSNHMLQAFEEDKHIGGIMYENDTEKTEKFFYMISDILKNRKKTVRGGSFGQYIRAHGYVMPAIVAVIDNYSSFREKTDNKYESIIWELSRDGAAFGIFLVISSGGFGSSEIQNKIADNIRNVITLDMGDKLRYIDLLRTSHIDILPEQNCKGRGLVTADGTILEFQTAVCMEADDDYERSEKIKSACEDMNLHFDGAGAAHVPEIPEKPTWFSLSENPQFNEALETGDLLPFAYEQKTASLYSIDLSDTFCYAISGKSRSGRTETLKVIAAAAAQGNGDLCIIDSPDGQLKHFAAKLDCAYVSSREELFDFAKELAETFKTRNRKKRELLESGAEDAEIYRKMCSERRKWIFVSDFASFLETVYKSGEKIGSMAPFFENILEKGRLHNIYFVFDINTDETVSMLSRKLYGTVSGYRTGVHLGGALSNQKIFDCSSIPYVEQTKVYKPGVGMAFDADGATKIVLPSSKGV